MIKVDDCYKIWKSETILSVFILVFIIMYSLIWLVSKKWFFVF